MKAVQNRLRRNFGKISDESKLFGKKLGWNQQKNTLFKSKFYQKRPCNVLRTSLTNRDSLQILSKNLYNLLTDDRHQPGL